MAHNVLPQHRPHEQLRTEAPMQKKHSDKFVSAFVSSENNVDMSFRNPILEDSADHYKVGIDELTVNLSNLSMLEYEAGDVLFRVRRLGADNEDRPGDDAFLPLALLRNACEFKVDKPYLTVLEILDRFVTIGEAIGTFIKENGLVQPDPPAGEPDSHVNDIWRLPITQEQADTFDPKMFMDTRITPNCSLRFLCDRFFWANFVLEIPLEKYRYLLLGNHDIQYISLHPATGAFIPQPYVAGVAVPFHDWGNVDTDVWHETAVERMFTGSINILHTIDRRVTLEVGCSLPLKNSPMVDHGVESPDFVLGRYMMQIPYEMWGSVMSGNMYVISKGIGAKTLQGPGDRIIFHHLGAQQKIQTLRLRLWARVRTYDAAAKKWGMKTIICPVQSSDYWHIRLHFVPK